MKTAMVGVIVVGVLIVGGAVWYFAGSNAVAPIIATGDYKSATFRVEGQPVTLVNGRSEVSVVPGSASKVVTQYFGNEATGDLNGDGTPDVAYLITQNTGGSGTFFYVVGAIKTADGYKGTDAVLLGDRIAPQTTSIADGKVTVNYADRKAGEAMTVSPSVGKSLVLKLDPATLQFGEVAQNFEGEANPASMSLWMQTWTWNSTLYSNDTKVMPKKPTAFKLTFSKDNHFSATTDCNSVSGSYIATGNKIAFSNMISTLMYCDGSQEGDFNKMLGQVESYLFTSKGELVFALKLDTGTMIFR